MSTSDIISGKLSSQEEENHALAHDDGDPPKLLTPYEEFQIEEENLVLETTDFSSSLTFILGHPTNGILGTNVLGNDGNWVITEVGRRKWFYDTVALLQTGTYDANIDVDAGDIRLG